MDRDIEQFHRRLHQWYAQHGRGNLPWRQTRDPYAIYISEVMLQQTQVKTVLERYYFPFLQRFPTLDALARASQTEVLHAWQGLGYYNRAQNLQKAAQACPQGLPDSVGALMALPGIGRNTAHAVAAFAFRMPVAVMEANVKRVLSRIFAQEVPDDHLLWQQAASLLDHSEPFDYNQAMMDLGALVCSRNNPRCESCPASGICEGKASPQRYPAAKASKAIKVRKKKILVLQNQRNRYYAIPRSGRFLSGLFHFVEVDAHAKAFGLSGKEYGMEKAKLLGHIRQQYSHFTLEAEVWRLDHMPLHGKHWYSASELAKLPMSMAEQKILGLMEDNSGRRRA